MNSLERSAQPSGAQIDSLLNFLEAHRSLAKGYLKTQNAREQARRQWQQLALQLNSMGGAIKTSKQWTKYWTDKKSTTKKKAAARAAARRKTGGGVEEVVDLSEVEERIVTLLGGEGFATGDAHLGIQLIQAPSSASTSSLRLQDIGTTEAPSSASTSSLRLQDIGTTEESIIPQPRSPGSEENLSAMVLEPEQLDEEQITLRRTVTARRLFVNAEDEPPVAESQSILRPSLNEFIVQPLSFTRPVSSSHHPPSTHPSLSPPLTLSRTPTPITFPRPNSYSTRIDPTPPTVSPSRRGTTSQVSRLASTLGDRAHQGSRTTSQVCRPSSTLGGRAHQGRSNRIRPTTLLTPPSQRRTEFSRITDRFLRVEEQQLEIQRSHARFLEVMVERLVPDAERDRSLVEAVRAMGEGLKALAKAIKRD